METLTNALTLILLKLNLTKCVVLLISLACVFSNLLFNVLLPQDIEQVLSSADVQFLTEDYLPQIKAPVLVLHSDDDPIVPSYLGERLVNTTITRGKKNIELVRFGAEHRLRHRYIYRAPGVEELVQQFVQKTLQFRKNNFN